MSEMTLEEKKDCLKGEVWTSCSDKVREGDIWLYPIYWGNRFIFDVPAKNKLDALEMGISIIAFEEWEDE